MSRKSTGKQSAVIAVLAALLLALALAACGGGGSSSDTNASGSEAEESNSATTASDSSGGEKEDVSVVMGLVDTGEEFWLEVAAGGEAFAAEDGAVNLKVTGPPSYEPEAAQRQILDLLPTGQEAVGFVPQPSELWTRTMKTLTEELPGKVIAYGERPTATEDEAESAAVKTLVWVADKQATREMIEETIKVAKLPASTTGDVMLGQCVAGETGTPKVREEGLVEGAENLLPKATIVEFVSEPDPQVNTNRWGQELAAHPNTVLAAGTCGMDGPSLYKLKKSNNYDFPIGAMEVSPENIAGLESGVMQAVMASPTWFIGYTVSRMLTEAARGEELPEGFVKMPGTMFTKANVGEVELRQNDPEKFYKPEIEELFANGMPKAEPIEAAWK
jgi:ABC-type sugar transport system substrate-binding protein